MINSKLIIKNYTRDYFCDEFTDEFELKPLEDKDNVFKLYHNDCYLTTLDKEQLEELANYIQVVTKLK